MQITYNNNELKIDKGDHYYIGAVSKELFPEIIANDYEDIIEKSLNNFSEDNTTISHTITEQQYIIDFKFVCKPLKIFEIIKINITRKDKDFKDYVLERIEKLEIENKELKTKLSELATIVLKTQESSDEEDDDEDKDEDEDEDEDEEPDESKFVTKSIKGKSTVVSTKPVQKPIRGGKGKTATA
jgi:hypothetical protein